MGASLEINNNYIFKKKAAKKVGKEKHFLDEKKGCQAPNDHP